MEMKIRKFKKPASTWAGHSGQWGSQAEQGLQLGFLALSLRDHSYPLATDLHEDDNDDGDHDDDDDDVLPILESLFSNFLVSLFKQDRTMQVETRRTFLKYVCSDW